MRSQNACAGLRQAKPGGSPVPARSNQLLQRLLRQRILQPKLRVNQPGDVFEQEADRVADAVMRMPDAAVNPRSISHSASTAGLQRCSCSKSTGVTGECDECKSMKLQRSASASSASPTAPPIVHDVLSSPGQPLDAPTRSFMEPRFGHDFSRVRIHSDVKAAESAAAVNALAYTVGDNIVFAQSQYAPQNHAGQRVLAHELTHVVQQSSAANPWFLQRTPTFKGCKTKTKGKEDEREQLILTAIEDAKGLAQKGIASVGRFLYASALKDNFGDVSDDQKEAIKTRYQNIIDNLDNKTFDCTTKCKKRKGTDLCAEAEIPGSKIIICHEFGTPVCPSGPVALHEAAHNDGANGDVDRGKGYPPRDAVNNAYSYEYFIADVFKAQEKLNPKLSPKREVVPK